MTMAEPDREDFRQEAGHSNSTTTRVTATMNHVDANDELILTPKQKEYGQQYASVYFLRLAILGKTLRKDARETWTGVKINDVAAVECKKVLDIRKGNLVWIVGTIYRELTSKPNILDEVTAKTYGPKIETPELYAGQDSDETLLEDESGRIPLVGEKVDESLLVTGTVVAVLGTEDSQGNFQVVDLKLPGFAPQKPLRPDNGKGRYVAVLSGLNMGSGDESTEKLELLQQFLTGELGGEEDSNLAGSIARLIICGNSIARQGQEAYNPTPLKRLDRFLSDVMVSLPVSVMPGGCDPSNATIPQQAFHRALFSQARAFEEPHFSTVTNPHTFDIDGCQVFATSGQTINDMFKYNTPAKQFSNLSIMHHTLLWSHVAPTCPDTLWSYPFSENDPFVMRSTPHIYLAGNQSQFSTQLVQHNDTAVRLVAVPEFSSTCELVLINMDTLDVERVRF